MIAFSPRRLHDARTAAALTPEHVAVATGRSSFSVREWERGRVTPPTHLLGTIAAALGVDVADLFEEDGDPDAPTVTRGSRQQASAARRAGAHAAR
jgi:transcriptional regulator with XRE-family HTH domain